MMDEIRWGIIGCGDVTEVKSGPAFNKVPNSKLVAVMRRNAEKAADYARRHGVPKWYTDAKQLINDPEVNAVYIATPPDAHEAYALACIEAGKPVYIEKPMTLNAASAQNIAMVAQRQNIKVSIAHYRRQQPYFNKIKELLDSGILGEVLWIDLRYLQPFRADMLGKDKNTWRINPEISGGGLFHDLAPHQLDLLLHLFGAPQMAKGIAYNKGGYYSAADTVSGTALLPRGIIFQGLWSFVAPEGVSEDICEIRGTKGSISFSVFGKQVLHVHIKNTVETFEFEPPAHVQQPMIEKVVAYFRGDVENPCSAAEGVRVMQWLDAFTNP